MDVAMKSEHERLTRLVQDIAQADRRRMLCVYDSERVRIRNATADWIGGWAEWDVACCWHASAALRNEQQGYDAGWLERKLNTFFNRLSNLVYADMRTADRKLIARAIVMEHDLNVGWHAHGVVKRPAHISHENFNFGMRLLWEDVMACDGDEKFAKRLFWCEEMGDGYIAYCLKRAIDLHDVGGSDQRAFIAFGCSHQP